MNILRITGAGAAAVLLSLSLSASPASALADAATVTTRVVDDIGRPIGGICVHVVDWVWSGQSSHMSRFCSDAGGALTIGPFEGSFNAKLYAFQATGPVRFGDQWVGQSGGTGDQRDALLVRFVAGQAGTIPEIRMDPPGTISGTTLSGVTKEPVSGVCAFPFAFDPSQGIEFGRNCSDAEGRYVIDDVGPYHWPVEFTPTRDKGLAWMWSGGSPDRLGATYSFVTRGGSVTVDAVLRPSGVVAGHITRDGQDADSVYVTAYNKYTHDVAGPSWAYSDFDGNYVLPGYATQPLWVKYHGIDGEDCWYGDTPAAATAIRVVAGETTDLPLDMAQTCAADPFVVQADI